MPPPKPVCQKCGNQLAPAALNPKVMWCSICAEELNTDGSPIKKDDPQPSKIVDFVPRSETVAAPADNQSKVVSVNADHKFFNVQIGNVSFVAQDRVELDIAGTKVVIT